MAPDRFCVEPSERPRASAFARVQAQAGPEVTDLRHRQAQLDAFPRALLAELDGRTDRKTLVERLRGTTPEDALLESKVDDVLKRIGAAALLLD